MRLYLDEMIAPSVAKALRDRGHDVVAAAERSALGASDTAQLARAIHEGRALVTYNVRDFAILAKVAAAAGQDHSGIILVSARQTPPSRIGALVAALDELLCARPDAEALLNQTVFLRSLGKFGER